MAAGPGRAVYIIPVDGLTNFQPLDKAGAAGIRLPAPPLDRLSRQVSGKLQSFEVQDLGTASHRAGSGLIQIPINSILPEPEVVFTGGTLAGGAAQGAANLPGAVLDAIGNGGGGRGRPGGGGSPQKPPPRASGPVIQLPSYCHQPTNQYPYREPYEWGNLLLNMAQKNVAFRLIIAYPTPAGGASLQVHPFCNIYATITDYQDYEDDPDARWFSATFTQFRPIVVRKVKRKIAAPRNPAAPGAGGRRGQRSGNRDTRPGTIPKPTRTTVRAGEDLMDVAERIYGSSAQWRTLAAVNGIDNPNNLKPGQEIVIPRRANEESDD